MPTTITGTSLTVGSIDLATPLATADGGTGLALTSTDKTVSAAGSAPTYACRAWGVFTGATGAMLASGNASVSRTSAGIYPVTFTTNMSDANYSVSIGFTGSSATGTGVNRNNLLMFRDLSVSGFNIVCTDPTSGTAADAAQCSFSVFR